MWTAGFEGQGIRVIRVNCWNYFLHRRLEGRSDCWHVVRLLWSLIATRDDATTNEAKAVLKY